MAVPKIGELFGPILKLAYSGETVSLSGMRAMLADEFYVPKKEAFTRKEGAGYSLFEERVNAACYNLCHAGLIRRVGWGLYVITTAGKAAVDSGQIIDDEFLRRIPRYRLYLHLDKKESRREWDDLMDQKEELEEYAIKAINEAPKPEFVPVERLTLDKLSDLIERDTRTKNLFASRHYSYNGETIMEVPREVRMHDMTFKQYMETASVQAVQEATVQCYETMQGAAVAKLKAVPPKQREGYHQNQKEKEKYKNSVASISNDGDEDKDKTYKNNKNLLDYIRTHQDFCESFSHLIKDFYKIKVEDLSMLSGVGEKTIQRMMNDHNHIVKAENLVAICWVLKVYTFAVTDLFELAGLGTRSQKMRNYIALCTSTYDRTYEDVNKIYRRDINPNGYLFPLNLTGYVA
ncbi:MAG: winged helix-turn-helix domain-containing protein [Lachnospiraceae bacterium]|nr:winged helix-turn-helix domain-containing protein [Lachnospiraceae bacterium]